MEPSSQSTEPSAPEIAEGDGQGGPGATATATAVTPAPTREGSGWTAPWLSRFAQILSRARFAILVYLGTRVLLLVVAIVEGTLRHHALTNELTNWDGYWFRWIANHGYPDHVLHVQTRLGFFPLYPLVIWPVSRVLLFLTQHSAIWCITVAGVIVSGIGGLIAAVIVQRLAAGWWGERAGRRAVALFCLFPGSVVFSMVYAEGILLPLAAACILALQRRRWLLAGILAGFATATQPDALVLIVVCAVSAGLELRRHGWRDRAARRSLLAPLLSVTGVAAVAAFFWAWAGSPFATLIAQRYGWKERTDALALLHLTTRLAHEISFAHFNHPPLNLNLVVALAGSIVLLVLLILLVRVRREVSVEALVWTLGISFLAATSEYTPPNPRLLITAFPAVVVLARYLKGRPFAILLVANGVLLAGLSAPTFVGITLRP